MTMLTRSWKSRPNAYNEAVAGIVDASLMRGVLEGSVGEIAARCSVMLSSAKPFYR